MRFAEDHATTTALLSCIGLLVFFVTLLVLLRHHFYPLFLDPYQHGQSHRKSASVHLGLLVTGVLVEVQRLFHRDPALNSLQHHQQNNTQDDDNNNNSFYYFCFDMLLCASGIVTTLTAARDFPHRHIRNAAGQSGTLSQHAVVTQAEMMEHAFYQFLNLWQAGYLHVCIRNDDHDVSWLRQWCALTAVTAPWWFRRYFPVHSFSDNWTKQQHKKQESTSLELFLYRLKKSQYLFYKHVILHGLNLSQCVQPTPHLVTSPAWRLFWITLHTSYVMEFFLQTLVRRSHMSQSCMLYLNRWLMGVASVAAVGAVLQHVQWGLCVASLVLNFIHRHHDVFNTVLIGSVTLALRETAR